MFGVILDISSYNIKTLLPKLYHENQRTLTRDITLSVSQLPITRLINRCFKDLQ